MRSCRLVIAAALFTKSLSEALCLLSSFSSVPIGLTEVGSSAYVPWKAK